MSIASRPESGRSCFPRYPDTTGAWVQTQDMLSICLVDRRAQCQFGPTGKTADLCPQIPRHRLCVGTNVRLTVYRLDHRSQCHLVPSGKTSYLCPQIPRHLLFVWSNVGRPVYLLD